MGMKKLLDKIRKKVGIEKLAKRERFILGFGVVFVTGFVLLQSLVLPYLEARETMIRSLNRNEKNFADIQLLRQEYLELKSKQVDIKKRLANRSSGFSLFSFIEERAAGTQVKDRVTYMKPSANVIEEGFNESIVEMKMERVTLDQLVSFLKEVESEEMIVSIQRISIQENSQDRGLLDTVIRIKTFEMGRT